MDKRSKARSGRVVICQNPMSGARSGAQVGAKLAKALSDWGFRAEVVTDPDKACDLAGRYRRQGNLIALVAAGGDGTVARLLHGTPTGIAIAVLPLGTENLVAKYIGMPADPAVVARAVCQQRTRTLDAGLANGRTFLLLASCGFDADVVRRLHGERHGHIHHLSYAKPILDSIRSYQYPELRVYCQTAPVDGVAPSGRLIRARWVFAANLPQYAAGLKIAPRAVGDDGLLDVCTFRAGSLWNGLRYLVGVTLGQHERWPDVTGVRVSRLRIESDEAVPYQVDGDPGGMLPLEIEVLPERATLICPPDDVVPAVGRSGRTSQQGAEDAC